MSLPVRRTNRAESDIDDIWLWIAEDSIAAAEEFTDRVEAAENRLARYPEIGQARPDLAAGVRHWPIAPYPILYRAQDDGVLILRVVHGARDLPRLFRA